MKKKTAIRFLGLVLVIILISATESTAQITVESTLADDTEITAGSSYERKIVIANRSNETQQARIYQTDYLFDADGNNYYGQPGTTVRSNANWIHTGQSVVTIPPLETASVAYRVDVPAEWNGEPLEGSYWSMIMVEGIPSGSPESTLLKSPSTVQVGLREIFRYGVQVATHVRDTGSRRLLVSSSTLVMGDDGALQLHLDIENVGNRLARPNNWVELYDANGSAFGRHEGTTSRIYPGTSVQNRYDLGDLKPGSYRALVILDSGDGDVDAAEFMLTIE